MNKDLKIILIIIVTLGSMFATTLLLDLNLVSAFLIRELIVYLTIGIQLFIGFTLLKFNIMN